MEKYRVEHFEILSFFVIATLLLFWGNHSTVLWNQDEAAYAGFAKTMIEHGNWLIPEFHWSEVHRKTPFHFWMISISMLLFGINEFAVRFSSVLFTLGTFALLYFYGRKVWSDKVATISCYVLLSSILVPSIAKIAVTDATLLFFETWCALSLLLLIKTKKAKWILQFWISFCLALLTKGPPVVIFTGTLGLLLLIFHQDGRNIWKLKPFLFFPIALLPLFGWGYLAWQTDDGVFIKWLIDWYILRRVDGNVFGQTGPPGYYLGVFLISFWIWLPFLIGALWRSIPIRKNAKNLEWALWLFSGWLMYEFVSSKLPAYTIAAHPALAIGIAHVLIAMVKTRSSVFKKGYIFFLSISLIGCLTGLKLFGNNMLPGFLIPFIIFIICLHMSIALIYWHLRLGLDQRVHQFTMYAALLPNIILWMWILPLTQPALDGHIEIANYLKQETMKSEFHITIGNKHGKPPSLPFYLEEAGFELEMQSDTVKLLELYNTQTEGAFILSEKQFNYFEQNSPGFQSKVFESFSVDHQKMEPYFVVLKK